MTGTETIIDGGPIGLTKFAAQIPFHSPDANATFECRLDGPGRNDAFQLCTSPAGYGGLQDGAHTFRVRAKDAAGNFGPESARQFTLDTRTPDPPNVTAPANGAQFPIDTVRFQGLAEPHATIKLVEGASTLKTTEAGDAGAWVIDLTDIPDGPHTYSVTATDGAD